MSKYDYTKEPALVEKPAPLGIVSTAVKIDLAKELLLKKMALPKHANDVVSHLLSEAINEAENFSAAVEKKWGQTP